MTDKIPYISSFYIQPDNKITKKLLENNQYPQRKEGYSRKTEGFCMVFSSIKLLYSTRNEKKTKQNKVKTGGF